MTRLPSHPPARRFIIAQSWWIASELVRRHPRLRLIETHPGGGQYDCLSILRGKCDDLEQIIQLNRHGRMHVGTGEDFAPIEWSESIAVEGGHDVVQRLEKAASLAPSALAPPSGPAVLSYRVIARVLASLVNDRHTWDARNGQIDSSEWEGEQRPELVEFPSVVEALRDRRADDILGIPAYRFWLLLRGDEPVSVLDVDGQVHLANRPPRALLPLYHETGRSLTALIGRALGHVLP